jgi:hypothetical protein
MHFESRWVPDAWTLKKVAQDDAEQGAWIEVGKGGLEPSLGWLGRLLQQHPERGRDIAHLILEMGQQGGAPGLAVAVLLAAGHCPWLLEVAQFLAYRLGPGEARDTLHAALPTLEHRARSVRTPYACVVLNPEPSALWLSDAETLLAAAKESVEMDVPRTGGAHPLDWLAELAPRLPWVGAAVPSILTALLEGGPKERRAALSFGLHATARHKLAPVWQRALASADPWLQEPAPPSWPSASGQTLGQVLLTLAQRR